jgi:hypothetical protein
MNSPCITATVNTHKPESGDCVCVISERVKDFRGLKTPEKRELVTRTAAFVVAECATKKHARELFASGTLISHKTLRDSAADRWDLTGGAGKAEFPKGWFTAADLLEMRQGVTPGGCLEVFLMDKSKAELLQLEDELVHRAIKSKQLDRWRAEWKDLKLFYPYERRGKKAEPAFAIAWEQISDHKLADRLTKAGLEDALDFDIQIDSREIDIVRSGGINNESVKKLLKHRTSLGIVRFPRCAEYLVENYERLHGRIFEKRRFTDLGKRWYEYHRPRDPQIMLGKPRILSPTLIREVRFAVDAVGYLSDHACLMIQPTKKKMRAWEDLRSQLNKTAGRDLNRKELLRYCSAFMNSRYAQERLVTGHRPTPKGSYGITEAYLGEIPIPVPLKNKVVVEIIELVKGLERSAFHLANNDETKDLEDKLQVVVDEALAVAKA